MTGVIGASGGAVQATEPTGAFGLHPGEQINHLRGQALTVLVRPEGATVLVLVVERGDFRFRPGEHATMPDSANVEASVTDGTGTWRLSANPDRSDRAVVLPAPEAVTVRGYGNNHVLTYSWR